MRILAFSLALVLLPWPASAQDILVLDAENAIKLEELLRDGDAARALAETLKAVLATKEQENAALREALERGKAEAAATREALIRADERDTLRAESVALLKDALAEYRDYAKEAREEIKALRKQAAIDKVLGAIPLIGMALLLFGFGH
jgi:hypothetical protein